MKRKLGSIVSTLALLAVAGGAAAVNVKILRSNDGDTSVLSVQEAADVTPLTNPTPAPTTTQAAATTQEPAATADPAVTPEPTATSAAAVTTATPAPSVSPKPITGNGNPQPKPGNGNGGKTVVGSVGGGGGGGDHDGEDGEDGEHEGDDDHGDGPRGRFVALSPEQMALLRVAALAQVRPSVARDAANGIGPNNVIKRVRAAADRVGVSLSDLAAITDLPPERGRGHGGNDEEHEGDDDD